MLNEWVSSSQARIRAGARARGNRLEPAEGLGADTPAKRGWRARALVASCHVLLGSYFRLQVFRSGEEPEGPFLVCANHRSHVDSIAIMAALGLPFHRCGLLAAEDYFFRTPKRLQYLSGALSLIPVERHPTRGGFERTVADCARFLETGGRALVAYPEGTRGFGPGVSRFKRGPALLALRLGLPIVPGYIAGTDRILPKGRWYPKPGRITVRLGPPLFPEYVAPERPLRERSVHLIELLEHRVRDLAVALDDGAAGRFRWKRATSSRS